MAAPDLVAIMPFAQLCGITVEKAEPDEVIGVMEWKPERCTAGGILHGGALMTLADSVGALCAFLQMPPGVSTATIESKTNFFRPLARGRARAVSKPLHKGSSIVVVQTDILDDDGKRVAQVTQSQAVLKPK
jgi:uncharacterized protein (TIGR00369 family)